jgi:hypothetical protein
MTLSLVNDDSNDQHDQGWNKTLTRGLVSFASKDFFDNLFDVTGLLTLESLVIWDSCS